MCNNIDDLFIEKLAHNSKFISIEKPSKENIYSTASADFIQQVNAAVEAIEKNQFHKVVLSKTFLLKRNDDFSASDLFLKLCVLIKTLIYL